jgi:hypothetical protein
MHFETLPLLERARVHLHFSGTLYRRHVSPTVDRIDWALQSITNADLKNGRVSFLFSNRMRRSERPEQALIPLPIRCFTRRNDLPAHARTRHVCGVYIDKEIDALPFREQLRSRVRDRVLAPHFFGPTNCEIFSVVLIPPMTYVEDDARYELITCRDQTTLAIFLSKDSLRFGS